MQKINAEDLAQEISASLANWEADKWAELDELIEDKGAELLERVKRDAPVKSGKYKRGFKVVKSGNGRQVKMTVKQTSNRYRIMHLLEYGHASRSGGRVRAFPHLKQNEADINAEFEKEAAAIYARE